MEPDLPLRGPRGVLYITYDGLLDPLGGSQILPYVRGIAAHPRRVHVLSFEKPERFIAAGGELAQGLEQTGIGWTALQFTRGRLGKVWDLGRMCVLALVLSFKHGLRIVHCRGHVPVQVGALVKLFTGARLIFDFRGLWADERVDKGSWNLSKPFDKAVYAISKCLERALLRYSDQVVVLTKAIKPHLVALGASVDKITVIPCCADFDHFKLPSDAQRLESRVRLGLPLTGTVLGYLGSIGRMYMTELSLAAVESAIENGAASGFLCITPDIELMKGMLEERQWSARGIQAVVLQGHRDEIPGLLAAMDVLVAFFLPTPARVGTSPTKIAECFAQGLPLITNTGVGDGAALLAQVSGGLLVDLDDPAAVGDAWRHLDAILAAGGHRLRDAARPVLGLEHANAQYREVYGRLEGTQC